MAAQVSAVMGDITQVRVDAIVNAANSSLLGGGGVDGAIHEAAGPELLEECRLLRATTHVSGLDTGEAVGTRGHRLPASWVVHTVGPIHHEHPDGGVHLLRAAHVNSMRCAHGLGARSIAFPAISCGVYGWDAQDAAPIAVQAVADALVDYELESVQFVLFNETALGHFAAAVESVWGAS